MAAPLRLALSFLFIANIISNIHVKEQSSSQSTFISYMYFSQPSLKRIRCDLSPPVHRSTPNYIIAIALLLSGDIQVNPGPETVYPCGYCEIPVTWQHQRAVCCDECSIWYHSDCIELSSGKIDLLCHSSTAWICCKCETQNVDNFTYQSYELDISNRFQTLSNISSVPSIDSTFSPKVHSSPKPRQQLPSLDSTTSHKSNSMNNKSKQNLRVLIVNCQSIRNKRAALSESVEYVRPDIIIGCESWLNPEHTNAEIFPSGYQTNVYRKDRNKNGGGVFIAINDNLTSWEVENSQSNCEAIWAEVKSKGKSVLIGSYYRPPSATIESLEQLSLALHNITNYKYKNIIIAGDFNLPHINWDHSCVTPGAAQMQQHQELLNIMNEHGLEQIQFKPTRQNNILDLYLTNHPSLVKSSDTIPGISDHHMVVVDSDIKPKYIKPKRRKIYKYKQANWEDVKTSVRDLGVDIMNSEGQDVETKWMKFRDGLLKILDDTIPSKLTSKRHNMPWINAGLQRDIKRKHKLFQKAKKGNSKELWDRYKEQKRITQRNIRQAHWNYVNNVIEGQLQEGNNKSFWKYIKAKRHDNIGVAGIKHNGILHQDSKDKAELLNAQFKSVFTKDKETTLPPLSEEKFPDMPEIVIDTSGVEKLLLKLSIHKASGPDAIPNTMLKNCATELSPVLTNIFQQSLETGTLPSDWKKANVSPVFKKGNKHTASNYRPVSLTSVCCKVLEHIICSNILKHLEQYNILTELQHGFRSGHSCESQLIITMHDLMKTYDGKVQTDMIILDFSKAFDTVPHRRLLYKLSNYGITGSTHAWIQSFLLHREQRVVIEGESSAPCTVDSGVPQGTVLGPLLFLCHINDLPRCVSSQVRLFADDCLIYRPINNLDDQLQLQKDLYSLEKWADQWGMRFNATKCYLMSIYRSKTPLQYRYLLDDHILKQVQDNPYLGITINENLKWSTHINKIANRSNSILGFIRRNLKHASRNLKETAYISLVRSIMDYSSVVWDPHIKKDIDQLEAVQRRAARFVQNDYSKYSSVTDMMQKLKWQPLHKRRRDQRLILLYKIINGLVAIPADSLFTFNTRPSRNSHSRTIKIATCNSDVFKNSFIPKTIQDWNKLPETVSNCSTLEQFRSLLRENMD